MKTRLLSAALAGALLLTGCSAGNSTPEAQPDDAGAEVRTPLVDPGSLVSASLGKECVVAQEPPVDFVSFIGECEGYDAVEFNPAIYGATVDKTSALQQLADMYIEAGRGSIWVVSDKWAINTNHSETAKQFLKEDDTLEIFLPNGEPQFLNDQIADVKAAMKDVTGIDCNDKGQIDDSEIVGIGCKKNGEYYAILGFFGSLSSLEYALVEPKEMFRFAKRDTFVLNGSTWLIYDVPESDAHQLQALLGGTVENLGEEPE